MNPIIMGDALMRTAVLLAIGQIAVWFLRRQPAALRHWVLATAIAMAAAQPAIRTAVPEWRIPATTVVLGSLMPDMIVADSNVSTVAFEAAFQAEAANAPVNWIAWLVNLWLAGTLLGLAAMAVAIAWLWWHSMRSGEAGGPWPAERVAIASAMGLTRAVAIRETQHPALLVTWGAWRPLILLPRGASAWPRERVQLVLAHELAHVQRRDWLVQVAAELARACYWPNPLFWLACRRLRIESEQACDDRVLAHGITGTSYASHLVDLARSFRAHGRTWQPAPSMARPSTLERRVVAMLNANINRLPVSRWRRAAAATVLIATAVAVAAASERAGAPGGVLRDPSGRVMPAATVRLSAIGQDTVHETQTDSTGTFQFPEIADGDYMLSARVPGFQSARQRIQVSSSTPPLSVVLQVGTLRETITVRAGDPKAGSGPSNNIARPMPAAPACGATTVGGNLKPPMKLRDVRPRYHQTLIDNNIEGSILLEAIIGVDGRVRNVAVVSPVNADLEEDAVRAVSQWEFSPTYLNCGAVEVRMFVTVNFSLER